MDFMPNAAIAMAIVLLLAIGLCLAHMMSSQRQDARLQFLLNLMQTLPASGDQFETPQLRGSQQDPPERAVVGASRRAVAQATGSPAAPGPVWERRGYGGED